jgi:integrase
MPIYQQTDKNGYTIYMVVVTAQINGKQVNRKRRSITSLAKAKRIEVDLKIGLHHLRDNPVQLTLKQWSDKCVDRMTLQFKKSTLIGYRGSLRKWIIPNLGHYPINEITGAMIHELIYEKIQKVSMNGRKGILKHFKRILTMAVEEGIINRNPALGIVIKVPEANQHVLNKTEVDTLLFEAKKRDHPYFNHWVMAIMTGMRTGELHALTWTDIDFDNKVIAVTKSWGIKDGLGPTKSTKNRYIPISVELDKFLKKLKLESVDTDGTVLEELDSWLRGYQASILREFCAEIGVTSIKFHDLRATFITQMLIKGVPLAKVMKIVGHATIKTTMRYLRLVAQDTQGATESLGITLPEDFDHQNVINLFND